MRIPDHFFLNGDLHKKIQIVKSDDTVIAWSYRDQKIKHYPLTETRRLYKKAYRIGQAATLMNVRPNVLRSIFKQGLAKMPAKSYDLNYREGSSYISEEDMVELRQIAWDLLPKNKYGAPYNDTMVSEKELIHRMNLGDSREYVIEDGDIIKIFKA